MRRCGLVASSGALRLRSYGLEVSTAFRKGIDYAQWFLNEPGDIRASNQLEIALTEFEVQGLELDWVGLCWGNDLHFDPSSGVWKYQRLKGTRWHTIRKDRDIEYLRNKYRVLLTRAREGMIIWVPPGRRDDSTIPPEQLDGTADFLARCGIASARAD